MVVGSIISTYEKMQELQQTYPALDQAKIEKAVEDERRRKRNALFYSGITRSQDSLSLRKLGITASALEQKSSIC